MKKESKDRDILDEYDFSGGQRGKYAKQYHRETNIVVLDPGVAETFPNSEAVNQALRSITVLKEHKQS